MASTILKGITWGHSRGITPLLAASQRFSELYPDVEINWKKRTLQEFADFPIEKLTEEYDLLIIDHPWVGCAAATNCVLPLEQYLSEDYLQDQLENSVGGSHESYNYKGHQWALAIDAATPAASYRADLFVKHNADVPTTWDEVIALAKKGKVAVPAIPIDLLMNFYMFCIAHGTQPFANEDEVIDEEIGLLALETMRELWGAVDKKMFGYNPIAVAEQMTTTNDYWYCPFAYCYSNYSRVGYTNNILTYTDLVYFDEGGKLRSTIGGTGLAISAFSKNKDAALVFAEMVVGGSCQSTFYVEHGGQPGHAWAWKSSKANTLTNNFFTNVLPIMERGYIRPRYNGYLLFQDHAGDCIQQYLLNEGNQRDVLNEINQLYKQSLSKKN
ncbi:MAG: carbohydrate transporter substrate-binding protein family [Segetibacter sp.]|nr:carbohydrate transporter substrate-binding protein family [Segetibacter sp.]